MIAMQVFDEYERRFASARAQKNMRRPWEEADRKEILDATKRMLGYQEEWVPQVHDMKEVSCQDYGTYTVKQLQYQTWKDFYASASLYVPKTDNKLPLVFLCCGHGEVGRLSQGYMKMAHYLTKLGMAVMVLDNIGQGDREKLGHMNEVAPFYCGMTLQGMIVMETVSIIRFMQGDERFDKEKFGACGNSGGGTLTLFLSALAKELSVISSSGYPSEFSYILQKEKKHCACNLLPGAAHGPEMWEIYSLFAPKPLQLEQGKNDHLIAYDIAKRNMRKVENTYLQMGKEEQCVCEFSMTRHSWEAEDMNKIGQFLSRHLLGVDANPVDELELKEKIDITNLHVSLPNHAKTTEEIAQSISGKCMPEGTTLADVFPPTWNGEKVKAEDIVEDLGRGNLMRIFAQMECALNRR